MIYFIRPSDDRWKRADLKGELKAVCNQREEEEFGRWRRKKEVWRVVPSRCAAATSTAQKSCTSKLQDDGNQWIFTFGWGKLRRSDSEQYRPWKVQEKRARRWCCGDSIELEPPHSNMTRHQGMRASDDAGHCNFVPAVLQSSESHPLYVLKGLQQLEVWRPQRETTS